MMLSDADIEKIRLEEICRMEVRRSLPSDPRPSRIWTFLNSNFGMWFLSALLVGGLGSLYTKYRDGLIATEKAKQAIERLDAEIGYRFSQVQVSLYGASRADSEREAKVRVSLIGLVKPPTIESYYQHLYPEYSSFGLPALLAELRRLEADPEQASELSQVMPHFAGLDVFFEVEKAPLSDPTRVAGAIVDKLVLGRWKHSWYFLDGGRESPFP
ncbi:MAG: hypothetical protein ABL962_10930 [Fimbriimonadaceae bacterium]